MKTVKGAGRVGTLLLGAFLVSGGSAWGRAVLIESIPADGEVLARAPSAVVLRFDGSIEPGGTRLNLSDTRGFGLPLPAQPSPAAPTDRLTVTLPLLGRGSYVLHYKVVASDGQPSHGILTFTAGGY